MVRRRCRRGIVHFGSPQRVFEPLGQRVTGRLRFVLVQRHRPADSGPGRIGARDSVELFAQGEFCARQRGRQLVNVGPGVVGSLKENIYFYTYFIITIIISTFVSYFNRPVTIFGF